MLKKLFALLLSRRFGPIGTISGGLTVALVLLLLSPAGLPATSTAAIAAFAGVAAFAFGIYVDGRLGATDGWIRDLWLREFERVSDDLTAGRVRPQNALRKLLIASYELTASPVVVGEDLGEKDRKERLEIGLWVVRHVLPLVPVRYWPSAPLHWIRFVEELVDAYVVVQDQRSWVVQVFRPRSKVVAAEWAQRVGATLDPSPPQQSLPAPGAVNAQVGQGAAVEPMRRIEQVALAPNQPQSLDPINGQARDIAAENEANLIELARREEEAQRLKNRR